MDKRQRLETALDFKKLRIYQEWYILNTSKINTTHPSTLCHLYATNIP